MRRVSPSPEELLDSVGGWCCELHLVGLVMIWPGVFSLGCYLGKSLCSLSGSAVKVAVICDGGFVTFVVRCLFSIDECVMVVGSCYAFPLTTAREM